MAEEDFDDTFDDTFDATWDQAWTEYWRPLLVTDGVLDDVKIENEMHDLVFIYQQVSEVYEAVTGGNLSKPMYYAKTIIDLYHEQLQKARDEGEGDDYDDHSRTQRTS